MVLDATRTFVQARWGSLTLILLLGGLGCTSGPAVTQHARLDRQFDAIDGPNVTQAAAGAPATIRSQSPQPAPNVVSPPEIVTSSAALPRDAVAPPALGDYQVRIVATIGTTPIYEREVREAVYQRLPEFINLGDAERRVKEHELFKVELRKIVERELILDELFAMLNNRKQTAAIKQLKEGAVKEANQRLRDYQKRTGVPNEEALKELFRQQGLTLTGMRRNAERGFMMMAYVGDRLKPKMNGISLADLRDYYEEHPDEFMTIDRVKWQDLFVRADLFRTRDDAQKYAEWLANEGRQGKDFAELIAKYDQGTKLPGGFGYGEEKGKISPPELEPTIFALKQGQIAVVDFGTGFHIVRIAERHYAGKRPFDEQVQSEVRRRLQAHIHEEEYRKIVDSLWRRMQPQILVD